MSYSGIENQIMSVLNDSCIGLGRDKWNYQIKEVLHNICIANYKGDNDCKLAFSDKSKGLKEMLFDFACFEYRYEEKFEEDLEISSYSIRNVVLVAELEWAMHYEDNLQPDFEKLLIAKSNYRLMVFRADNEESAKNHFKFFDEIIDNFKMSNISDRYLYAAGLNNDNGRFIFHLKVV